MLFGSTLYFFFGCREAFLEKNDERNNGIHYPWMQALKITGKYRGKCLCTDEPNKATTAEAAQPMTTTNHRMR